jgi:hypothetical protein
LVFEYLRVPRINKRLVVPNLREKLMRHWRMFVVAALLIALAVAVFQRANRPADIRVDSAVARLSERLSIPIVASGTAFPVRTYHGEINGRDAAPTTVASYLPILASEWELYPRAVIQKSGLRRIILCDVLAFAGQRRTAVPDFEHNDLYLDIVSGRYDEMYTRSGIHHEFFHIIDYRDDGELYADERWRQLNPADFRYGSGGKNAQDDAWASVMSNARPGFLNSYSTTGVEEDKAEVFANMIVNGKLLARRAAIDPVLHAKMQRMKELLANFCPEIDDDFWEAAGKVERPAN